MLGIVRGKRALRLLAGSALALFSAFVGTGCGDTRVPAAVSSGPDTPHSRLAACLAAAGYSGPSAASHAGGSVSYIIITMPEHARLVAEVTVRDGHADRQVVIYRAESGGWVAGVRAQMTESGLRVAAIASRRLIGVSNEWSPGPTPRVLSHCASIAERA